ncbi:MAG TPA: class I tRNA ligase family protein, partial [Candidatus Gracilibacteria bacterium]|nr:class I tRNA ligase family protein [Candidatus Gracilibacteria bacterium]
FEQQEILKIFRVLQGRSQASADQWITHRLNQLIQSVSESLNEYRYSEAGQKLYDFTWNEFCDWYLELSKGDKQNPGLLREIFGKLLSLLHPFVPFVTETLWQELELSDQMLAVSPWPQVNSDWNFPQAQTEIDILVNTISAFRTLKLDQKMNPQAKVPAEIFSEKYQFLVNYREEIMRLAKLSELNIHLENNNNARVVDGNLSIQFCDTELSAEARQKLEQEVVNLNKQLESIRQRLSNEAYIAKAPATLVEQSRSQMQEIETKIQKIEESLK